jgi:hypothetical protein
MPTLFVPLRMQVRFCQRCGHGTECSLPLLASGTMQTKSKARDVAGPLDTALRCYPRLFLPPAPQQGMQANQGVPFEWDLKRRGKIHLKIVGKGGTETDYFLLLRMRRAERCVFFYFTCFTFVFVDPTCRRCEKQTEGDSSHPRSTRSNDDARAAQALLAHHPCRLSALSHAFALRARTARDRTRVMGCARPRWSRSGLQSANKDVQPAIAQTGGI